MADVICAHCGCIYTKGVMARTQALGCSCEVYGGFIKSHYGSKHDTRMFRAPGLPNMDPICDECIDRLVESGAATDEREYLDFNEQDPNRRPN